MRVHQLRRLRVFLLIGLIVVVYSQCDLEAMRVRQLVGQGDHPFGDWEAVQYVLSENESRTIIETRSIFGSRNYYFSDGGDRRDFLLNLDYLDSGERLESHEWSSDAKFFVFFIRGAAGMRFEASTRLALYGFSETTTVELLDSKGVEITEYQLADDFLSYVDEAGQEHRVALEL